MNLTSSLKRKRCLIAGIGLMLAMVIALVLYTHHQVQLMIYQFQNNQASDHIHLLLQSEANPWTDSLSFLEEMNTDHGREALLISQEELLESKRIKQPLWSSYSYQAGKLDYSSFYRQLEQKPGQRTINWQKHQRVYSALSFQSKEQTFWLLESLPTAYYRQNWQRYWLVLALALGIQGMIVYLAVKLNNLRVTGPLKSLTEGIRCLQHSDFRYEYLDQSLAEVDHLGKVLTETIQLLEKDRKGLVAGNQQYSLLLKNLNLGVLVIDAKGKINLTNPASQDILVIPKGIEGRSYQSVIKSYQLIHLINQVMETQIPVQATIEVYVPQAKYLDVSILSFQDSLAKDLSYLVLLYDITQIRRLETVRSEFVANASHELRTPVTAIKGFAETLLAGALKDKKAALKFVNIIAKESNRLEIIIEDILELSRVEKRDTLPEKASFNVLPVVEHIVEFLAQKLTEKQINLEIFVDEGLQIYANQQRFEQILTNLVDNAINYSEETSQIAIRIKQKKRSVQVQVSDTGIGIPASELDRIFERFYRVDKARSRNSGGTGLGLSIVRNLVQMMDGEINVTSELGKGSTFTVNLPNK